MSSVFGLEGQAEHAEALALHIAEHFEDARHEAGMRTSLVCDDCLEDIEVFAERFRSVDEGERVLREAGAAVAEAGLEEFLADALVVRPCPWRRATSAPTRFRRCPRRR
jgi:hypothetical protein